MYHYHCIYCFEIVFSGATINHDNISTIFNIAQNAGFKKNRSNWVNEQSWAPHTGFFMLKYSLSLSQLDSWLWQHFQHLYTLVRIIYSWSSWKIWKIWSSPRNCEPHMRMPWLSFMTRGAWRVWDWPNCKFAGIVTYNSDIQLGEGQPTRR